MAKPSITKRLVKNAALTYTELDTNFQNIIDSILTVTDGTSDINLELIDTLEIQGQDLLYVTVTPSGNIVTVGNYYPDITRTPHGFRLGNTDNDISFNAGTRVFTHTAVAIDGFDVYVNGTQFTKTTNQTVTIPNVTGLYLIYYDSSGVLSQKTGYLTFGSEAAVAHVYWNATTSSYKLADQRHGTTMDWRTHEYLHRTQGARYANGFAASNYTLTGDGSSNSHAQIDFSSGTFYDEDLKIQITHSNTPTVNTYEQDLQGPARIPVAYHSGATGEWVFDAVTDYPVKQGTARITYNLNTAGTWTTPDITSTYYVSYWIVATNFRDTPVIAIMGQAAYNKLEDAENSDTWSGLDLTNFPSEEFLPLYRLIFRSATGYTNTPHAYLADIQDLRTVAGGAGTGVSLAPNSWGTIAVAGQNSVVADTVNDTLTLVAGTGITLTTSDTADSVTITNSSTASNTFTTFSVAGQSDVVADSSTDTLTLAAGTGITITTNATTDTITITNSSPSTGTVNSGAANALTYYPSAGTTVDDTLISYTAAVGLQTLTATNALNITGSDYISATPAVNKNFNVMTSGTGKLVVDTGVVSGGTTALILSEPTSGITIDGGTVGLTSATNSNVYITPNGTGKLVVQKDISIGSTSAGTMLQSNWNNNSTFLRIKARDNANWSIIDIDYTNISIEAGSTGNVYIKPKGGSGGAVDTVFGDASNHVRLTTNNTKDLILDTYSGINSGTIKITNGVNGNITFTPNGTGKTVANNLVATEPIYDNGNSGAATITPNAANGATQKYTLTGNITWNAFGTPVAGQSMTMILVQDGTGGKTLTSTMKFAGGSKTLSTAANAIDIITVYYDGTTYYASLSKGFA